MIEVITKSTPGQLADRADPGRQQSSRGISVSLTLLAASSRINIVFGPLASRSHRCHGLRHIA